MPLKTMNRPTYARSPLRNCLQADETAPALFTLFPRLPKELRLAIWRFTLPLPRRIRRAQEPAHTTTLPLNYEVERPRNPIALSINHESRSLALQHYKQEIVEVGMPRYIDYSADFIHEMEIPPCALQKITNLMQDYADSIDLENVIYGRIKDWWGVLRNLREVLVVVHYRDGQAYEPFKPTEMQVEKKLELMKPNILDRMTGINVQRGLDGCVVRWIIPNIVLETCKPCFRRRGGRHYYNGYCRGHLR
jgi:hypothetical protein